MAGGEQMPEISEILCGIYENRTYLVIVYNLNGTVLWQNVPVGRYFSENLDASRHINVLSPSCLRAASFLISIPSRLLLNLHVTVMNL